MRLEIERNEQLRYSHLELEIKRFKAIKLFDRINRSKISLQTQKELLDSKIADSAVLSGQIAQLRLEIEKLQADKMKFLQEVDTANKAKSQIESRISRIIYEYERKKLSPKNPANVVLK